MADKAKKGRAAKPAANGRKKANGYQLPEKLPAGEILQDAMKKEWILGTSIGKGGFGEIYSAAEYKDGKFDKGYPFVIKIEPHENGPLFVENNFYIRAAKEEFVEEWKAKEKKNDLGISPYVASGSHTYKDKNYRFLVIQRLGKDLWNLFNENKRKFPVETVYKCAIQIIDALEYIHSKGYVHGDIKGANLLLGLKKNTENSVFLVDFGLACKFVTGEFKRDPKQAHNGTIEYTSCDNHLGVPTRRGDLEITGYNLLQWINSTLPWEDSLKNKEKVHVMKQDLMSDVTEYFKKNLPDVPKCLVDYFAYVAKLKHDDSPDYNYCRKLFMAELKKLKCDMKKLEFQAKSNANKEVAQKRTHNLVQKNVDDEDDQEPKVEKRKRKQKVETVDNDEDDNEGSIPPKKMEKATRNKRNQKVVKPLAEENDEISVEEEQEEVAVQKKAKGGRTRKQKVVETAADNDEEVPENEEEEPVKKKGVNGRYGKKKVVKTAPEDEDNNDETVPVKQEEPVKKKGRTIKQNIVEIAPEDEDDNETVPVKQEEPVKKKGRTIKQNIVEIAPEDEDDNETVPVKQEEPVQKKGRTNKQNIFETASSDLEDNDDETFPVKPEEEPVKKGRNRKQKIAESVSDDNTNKPETNGTMQMRKRKIAAPLAEESDDDIIPGTPEEKPKAKRGAKKAAKKKTDEKKRTWRDCPTMQTK